jgi:hypothetical protein
MGGEERECAELWSISNVDRNPISLADIRDMCTYSDVREAQPGPSLTYSTDPVDLW